MLTGFQAEVIAFVTDGEIVCYKHVNEEFAGSGKVNENLPYWEYISELEEASGYSALSRYSLEEGSEGRGEWCGQCGDELVEQDPDYCTEHDGWRSYEGDGESSPATCEYGNDGEPCRFPDTDPNPPASRWVPCSTCGAGDGQSHDLTKHQDEVKQQGWTELRLS